MASFISFVSLNLNPYSNLLDTYSTLESGMPNYICVALSLIEAGCKHFNIRLDSGDLY